MRNIFIFALLLFAGTILAQTTSIQTSAPLVEGQPAIVEMSAERLSKIEAVFKDAVLKS